MGKGTSGVNWWTSDGMHMCAQPQTVQSKNLQVAKLVYFNLWNILKGNRERLYLKKELCKIITASSSFCQLQFEQNLLVFILVKKKDWSKQKSMSYVSFIVKTSGQGKLLRIFSITFDINFWKHGSLCSGRVIYSDLKVQWE